MMDGCDDEEQYRITTYRLILKINFSLFDILMLF